MLGNDHATILRLPISVLKADTSNARKISDDALAGLGVSLETFGPLDIVFNETTGELVSGHQRVRTLRDAGATEVERNGEWGWLTHPKTGDRFPVRFVQWDETKQRMGNLVANNTALQGEFTEDALTQLKELEGEDGFELLELDALEKELAAELGAGESAGSGGSAPSGSLSDRFGMPPFSVLDARSGRWQQRKREWLSMGIRSEVGRGDCTPGGGGPNSCRNRPAGRVSEYGKQKESDFSRVAMSKTIQRLRPRADQALLHAQDVGRDE